MLESSYKKPFVLAVCITLCFALGMSLSLRHMAGTGSGINHTELSFEITGESEASDRSAVQVTDGHATDGGPDTKRAGNPPLPEEPRHRAKEPSVKSLSEALRDPQWAPQRTSEEEESTDAATMEEELRKKDSADTSKISKPSTIPGDGIEGNGLPQEAVDGDLSFMNPMALDLLSPGLQEQLRPTPEKNAKHFLERVAEKAKRSPIKGSVVVRVNFSEDGEVQYTNVIDAIDPDVKNAAINIIWNSGSMENRTGRPLMLAVPVILGQ